MIDLDSVTKFRSLVVLKVSSNLQDLPQRLLHSPEEGEGSQDQTLEVHRHRRRRGEGLLEGGGDEVGRGGQEGRGGKEG